MEYPEIKFVITVEFAYNRKPDKPEDAVYHASRYHYGFCESLEEAKEKRNEVVDMLAECGYRVVTQIKDAPNSYTASVMCRTKGVECKVIIKDISVSPLSYIKRKAETCLKDGEEFTKWEFGE